MEVFPTTVGNVAVVNAPSVALVSSPETILAPSGTVGVRLKAQVGSLPRVGIEVRIYRSSAPTQLAAVLPKTRERSWQEILSQPGSGSFQISETDPAVVEDPTLLDYGNIVRLRLEGVDRFAFRIDEKSLVKAGAGEQADRWIRVKGPGVLALLDGAVIYPENSLYGNPDRLLKSVTAGSAMRQLYDEAVARGALNGIVLGFDDELDSYGEPYWALLDHGNRAGTNYLQVAQKHGQLIVDVEMTPSLVLRYFNYRGLDLTGGEGSDGVVALQLAHNIAEEEFTSSGKIANLLLVNTPGGFYEYEEWDSIDQYQRREASLHFQDVVDLDGVDQAAEAVLLESAFPKESVTIAVEDTEGARPYIDWGVGDRLLAPGTNDELIGFRVRALTVKEDADGRPQFIPELGYLADEERSRLERHLSSLVPGALGGQTAPGYGGEKSTATVVFSARDSRSPFRADYACPGENDQELINGVLAELPEGSRAVFLEGHYQIAGDGINVVKTVALQGQGPGTVFEGAVGVGAVINGQGSATPSVQIRDLLIDGGGRSGTTGIALVSDNGLIDNCHVISCVSGIIGGAYGGYGPPGWEETGSDYYIVPPLRVSHCVIRYCEYGINGADVIENNLLEECGGNIGYGIMSQVFWESGRVVGNTLLRCGPSDPTYKEFYGALNVQGGSEMEIVEEISLVANNTIKFSRGSGIMIGTYFTPDVACINNYIYASGHHGIHVRAPFNYYLNTRAKISGNQIRGSGQEASNAYDHIHIAGNVVKPMVTDNMCSGSAGYPTVTRYGIRIDNTGGIPNGVWINGNDLADGYLTAAISDAGAGTVLGANRI